MSEKVTLILSDNEALSLCAIHKDIMESLARNLYQYDLEKTFVIFSMTIGITISNFLTSFCIKDIDSYLKELIQNIKNTHDTIKKNSDYMEYKNGIKISEGKYN